MERSTTPHSGRLSSPSESSALLSNTGNMRSFLGKEKTLRAFALLLFLGSVHSQRYRRSNVTESAKKLTARLFYIPKYENQARPMRNDSKWFPVDIYWHVLGLRYVDVTTHKFSIIMLICLSWNDVRLRWFPVAYSNITSIRVSDYEIWTPQIIQSLSVGTISPEKYTPLIVSHEGNVTDCISREITSICYMDYYDFPYDKHQCFVAIEMIEMNIEKLKFNNEHLVQFSQRNGQWALTLTDIQFDAKGPIILHFLLERVSSHYTATVYMPTLAILLASLGASWIPMAHSGVRSSLLAGLLLINILLSRHICDLVEGSQTLPRIVMLQNATLGFLTLGIISSCVADFVHRTQSSWTVVVKQTQDVVDTYLLPAVGLILVLINQTVS